MKLSNGSTTVGTSASSVVESSQVAGDTFARYTKTADGTEKWGPGSGAADCILNRSSAGVMALTGSLAATSAVSATTLSSTGDSTVGGALQVNGSGAPTGGSGGSFSLGDLATAPTAGASGGGTLYSKSGVPTWMDHSGNTVGMVRTYDASSTGTLASFTTEVDVPGATVSVVVHGSNATVIVNGTFDMSGATTMVGFLNWNGADRTQQAIFVGTATTSRGTVAQTWRITGVAAGTYTCKLRGSAGASATTNRVLNPHTGLTVMVIEG